MRMLKPAAWKIGTPIKLDAEIPASSYSCQASDQHSPQAGTKAGHAWRDGRAYIKSCLDLCGVRHEPDHELRPAGLRLCVCYPVHLAGSKLEHPHTLAKVAVFIFDLLTWLLLAEYLCTGANGTVLVDHCWAGHLSGQCMCVCFAHEAQEHVPACLFALLILHHYTI